MSEDIIWSVKKSAVQEMLKKGQRQDGRKFDEFRKIEIQEGYIPKAEGSCLVKLGDTQILVGVKMTIGTPYPDSENQGNMMTSAELVPIADPEFYSGPPSPKAIEFARVVDRGIRESGMMNFEKLCIVEGEKVWTIMIDLHILDFNGNMFDAASIAAVKALWNTKKPKYDAKKEKLNREETDGKLQVEFKPLTATFVKIGETILLDPTLTEEKVSDAMMTMSIRDDDHLVAAQKSGIGIFTKKEIDEMLEIAIKRTKEIRKLI